MNASRGHVDPGHPLRPVIAIPWTKYRCRARKTKRAGSVAIVAPAKISPKSGVRPGLAVFAMAIWTTCLAGSLRTMSRAEKEGVPRLDEREQHDRCQGWFDHGQADKPKELKVGRAIDPGRVDHVDGDILKRLTKDEDGERAGGKREEHSLIRVGEAEPSNDVEQRDQDRLEGIMNDTRIRTKKTAAPEVELAESDPANEQTTSVSPICAAAMTSVLRR